jgi:DNA-binding response OmpR family regulator
VKKTIIIVEDDPDILFTINVMLENDGYQVIQFASPLSIVNNNFVCPDLFILDKRMPEMDGLEVCKILRSRETTQAVPIIVISASPRFGPPALLAGATDFLAKPFDMQHLLKMVAKYI